MGWARWISPSTADLEILRFELDVLQAPHALVDGDLAGEIAQPDLGQPKSFGQQGIARDDELGLAVAEAQAVHVQVSVPLASDGRCLGNPMSNLRSASRPAAD